MKLLDKATRHAAHDQAAQEVMDVIPLVMGTLRAQMRDHRTANLSVPQFRTLGYLERHSGASLSDVAEHIGLTLPSMSKLIEGLVERKLVARRIYSVDRRRVTLELSMRGRAVHQEAVSATRSFLIGRLAQLSERERGEVVRAMRVMRPLFAGEREREAEAGLAR